MSIVDQAMMVLGVLAVLFVFGLGMAFFSIIVMYIIDVTQPHHTIRRNYPVLGRFRYFFEHIGEFFRQYFFALDREELPFNRADRSWVYRAAKNVERTIAFGSTRNLAPAGEVLFLNSILPKLDTGYYQCDLPLIGRDSARIPYQPESFFNISGMSYGAISRAAIKALAGGARKSGVWMNTGEGGVSVYHLSAGCDLVVQIGTAKYGVRDENGKLSDERLRALSLHDQVKMFEIKLSQGAKPGKGGLLPGIKVTPEIAKTRGIPEGKDSISPNAHEEINSLDDLLDMIAHVREVTGKPVGIKFVLGSYQWLDEFFSLILHRGIQSAPDFITLDSADGGTGAAPQTLMDYVGLPLTRSLPMLVDKLTEYGLKARIPVVASGKLINPSSVAWAMCMGADFVVSARGFMFSIGCIQAMQCNKNTCPAGIATQNKKLERGLHWQKKSVRAANYVINMQKELTILAHACGVNTPVELTRKHAHLVVDPRSTVPMDELYPYASPKEEVIKLIVNNSNDEKT